MNATRSADDDTPSRESDATTRSRASDAIWTVMDGTASATGPDFFMALVQRLAQALDVPYAFVAESTDPSNTRVRTLAFWSRDTFIDNVEYEVKGTPCEIAIGGDRSYHPRDLQSRFPDDRNLVEIGAQSYLGLPLVDAAGDVLGHLAVLDVKPMESDAFNAAVMRTCAVRARMELERSRTTGRIAELNRTLEAAADRARTLLAINNALVLNLTREALFHAIVTALRPVIAFDRSAIFLYDEHKKVLRLVSAESEIPSEYFVPGLELGLDSSHAGWTFLNLRHFVRPDLAKERKYHGEDVLFREGFRSLIVAPLIVRDKSIGTLNLASVHPMQYGESEAELLQEVANQLALSIENMRAYEEIGGLNTQLERENAYLRQEILGEHGPVSEQPTKTATAAPQYDRPSSGTLEDVERAHILATLAQTGWVIEGPRGAAKILDMHPNTLRSRMKKLGLERSRHAISLPPPVEGV
jgi:GAF domain-containing protein